jgi:hypothetical protein
VSKLQNLSTGNRKTNTLRQMRSKRYDAEIINTDEKLTLVKKDILR